MNWRAQSGLTLMELLVALVLLSVIAAGLASSTSFGIQVLDRTQRLDETTAELALRVRLRQWLRTATSPALLTGFEGGVVGDATRLRFVTLAPAPFAPESAALAIIVSVADQKIIMAIEQLNDTGEVIATHNRELATAVSSAEISYYSNDPDDRGWQDSWDDANKLPLLIRITANGGSRPGWPEFTVRLLFAEGS